MWSAPALVAFAADAGPFAALGVIDTSARTGDREIMSDTDRVLLAVKLETDDALALCDRVAGCLVL